MVNDSLLELAEQAGANALSFFLTLLAIALILVAVGWWFFHGKFISRARMESPNAVYLMGNVLGLILVIGGVFIFIEIAQGITNQINGVRRFHTRSRYEFSVEEPPAHGYKDEHYGKQR